jgi:ureidoglycolate lyase
MKLLRYGPPGEERPGLLDGDGRIRDLSGRIDDLAGPTLTPASLAKLAAIDPETLPPVSGDPRLGPCVAGVGKFLGIGLCRPRPRGGSRDPGRTGALHQGHVVDLRAL